MTVTVDDAGRHVKPHNVRFVFLATREYRDVMDVARAVTARRLAVELSRMAALAAELADEAVWQVTRAERAVDVARALGVSEAAVRKAIRQHNHRMSERTDSDNLNRA